MPNSSARAHFGFLFVISTVLYPIIVPEVRVRAMMSSTPTRQSDVRRSPHDVISDPPVSIGTGTVPV